MSVLLDEIGSLCLALMLFAFWTWLAVGVGRGLLNVISPRHVNRLPWWQLFWWGWGGILMVLQVTHVFWPIRYPVVVALAVFGGWGTWGLRMKRPVPSVMWGLHLALLSTALVLTRQPYNNYDTALYHYNLIEWQNEHPLIKGLGRMALR